MTSFKYTRFFISTSAEGLQKEKRAACVMQPHISSRGFLYIDRVAFSCVGSFHEGFTQSGVSMDITGDLGSG
jgi:hypothetical protein